MDRLLTGDGCMHVHAWVEHCTLRSAFIMRMLVRMSRIHLKHVVLLLGRHINVGRRVYGMCENTISSHPLLLTTFFSNCSFF